MPRLRGTETIVNDQPIAVKIDRRIARLVPKFLAHCRRSVELLRAQAGAGEFTASRAVGHSLAGTASSYGFGEIGAFGEQIERAALAADAAALHALAQRLENYLDRVRPDFD